MKKIFSLILVSVFLFASCAPVTALPELTSTPTHTVIPSPTQTETPILTSTPTLIPTPTLSPDLNTYQCAENVSKENCDFVKEGVRLARYYFLNNYGSDILTGVKFEVINDPKDTNRGEGGTAGAFQVPKQGEPFVWINTGHSLWTEYSSPEFQHNNTALVVHEFTHAWQWQHGCISDKLDNPSIPTGFLTQGYAQYNGLTVSGVDLNDYAFSDALALSFWQANQWNENKWFDNTDVNVVVVKHLIEDYGFEPFTQYCNAVGQGEQPNNAFQSAYGISILDFRANFKDKVLGSLKNCTIATCGAGVDNYSDKYKLKHLIDTTRSTPNLIMNFVDENNAPVALTHLSLSRQGTDGNDDYAQPFTTPETFSVALLPGRYIFSFCEPGYPVDQSDFACQMHETDWIDVYSDQVTNITLQVPPSIDKLSLAAPDLIVKFTDKDGNPLANLGLQVCNYDTPVKVCSPTYPKIRKTDANGIYRDSLRSGKYFIRVSLEPGNLGKYDFNPFYLIENINVDEAAVSTLDFQFPNPNLIVKFMDVNGSPILGHGFILCKIIQGVGDCSAPDSTWVQYASTNKKGIFEAQVEPGEYYILTCKLPDCPPPYEIKITNIVVANETEVTTVEYPLYKKK